MYFTRIGKTQAQLEVMIDILQKEYGAQSDEHLAELMSKYFEVSVEDALSSLSAYNALKGEDYEQQSKRIEYA